MIENFKQTIPVIDRDMVKSWAQDLVFAKTFVGLRFQEAILKKMAELKGCDYRLAHPYEESQGIDGFVGDRPVSIKPLTYKAEAALAEKIEATIVYYDKKTDGIVIEIPDGDPPKLF